MHPLAELWGPRIHEARKRAGLTQVQVAEACGISQQRISNWEHGRAVPRDRTRPILARVLGVSVNELFAFPVESNAA